MRSYSVARMSLAARYLSVSQLVHHHRPALFVFFPHVPGRNLCGLTAIGIPWADTIGGIRDTGPVRRMQAHVGLVPATKADGITTAIGKAIADDSNTGTTGITIVTAATMIAIATIMTSRNNFQTDLEMEPYFGDSGCGDRRKSFAVALRKPGHWR